jgi:hypothetical protein
VIYHQDSTYRSVDGPYAKTFYIDVPLASLREIASNDIQAIATVVGGLLTNDTTPNLEYTNGDTDSAIRLDWAASNSDPVAFQCTLPGDIDTEQNLYVDIYADMAGATDTPVISLDTFFNVGDTKVEDDTGAASASPAVITATIAAADVPFSPFLTMSCELTPGAHTTDVLYVYGIRVRGTRL